MFGVCISLATVAILTFAYGLVWLFLPGLHDWMESPRDHFLEQQQRFPEVVHSDPPGDSRIARHHP
jgi:hypothetical protein